MMERQITDDGRRWHVREYDVDEFLRAATDEPPNPLNKDNRHALKNQNPTDVFDDWMGASVVEARALRTWPAGRARMAEINLDRCELPQPKTRRRVRCWSDDGDEFDRDRFDAGLDDCWQAHRPRSVVGGNTIRLTIELGANVTRSGQSLIWSGAAAASLPGNSSRVSQAVIRSKPMPRRTSSSCTRLASWPSTYSTFAESSVIGWALSAFGDSDIRRAHPSYPRG